MGNTRDFHSLIAGSNPAARSMQLSLYVLAAVATLTLIFFAPVAIGYGLLIAWFAWCGGVLFDRLFLSRITT